MKMSENKKIFIIALTFAIIFVFPLTLYALNIGGNLSHKNEDWGDFGSFIGGVYGSIFSSLSLIAVLWATVETKRNSAEQLKILKNDQHSNDFKLLTEHLKKNFRTTFKDVFGDIRPIETHFSRFQLTLSISTIAEYDPDSTIINNLIKNGIRYYKQEHPLIFKNEAKLLVCILELIKNASPSSAQAYRVIFESMFSNDARLCLEMYTRAHYPKASLEWFENWPSFSEIPERCLKAAEDNLKANGMI